MSRHVVRYEGVGKSRRPIYADEGPASAAVRDPVAAIGVLSATQVRGSIAVGGGAGAVERRQATEAQMAAAREREAEPVHLTAPSLVKPATGPHISTAAHHMQASRQRGAKRHVEVMADRNAPRTAASYRPKPVPPPPEEEIVSEQQPEYSDPMTEPDVEALSKARGDGPEWSALGVLADAVLEMIEADTERTMAATRWLQARMALDAAYRALEVPTVVELAAAIAPDNLTSTDDVKTPASTASPSDPLAVLEELQEEESRASVALDGETQVVEPVPGYDARAAAARSATIVAAAATDELEREQVSTPPAVATGGGPGTVPLKERPGYDGLTTFQRRALEATIRYGGDRKAAAKELGVNAYQSIDNALEAAGEKGALPIELIPKLPARFAKYQGV